MAHHVKYGIIIYLLFSVMIIAQTKTNFELLDSLLFDASTEIVKNVNESSNYILNFAGSDDYSILKERLVQHLYENGIGIGEAAETGTRINFTLIEARTNYPELFKDHIFGSYYLERSVSLRYAFNVEKNLNREPMNERFITAVDTVLYSELPQLENIAYSFSSSEVPDESLFSSALEPVIAIGTAAVAVYLFFNIRSK